MWRSWRRLCCGVPTNWSKQGLRIKQYLDIMLYSLPWALSFRLGYFGYIYFPNIKEVVNITVSLTELRDFEAN